METVEKIPRTALDVFRMLPEGTLCEVLNNVLHMSPAPIIPHQILLLDIASELRYFFKKNNIGKVLIAPVDVYLLEQESAIQPDIAIVLNERMHIIKNNKWIEGTPDIVIEILSANRQRDLEIKKNIYEKAGVTEYIIVDIKTLAVYNFLRSGNKFLGQSETKSFLKSEVLNFSIMLENPFV